MHICTARQKHLNKKKMKKNEKKKKKMKNMKNVLVYK